MKWGSILDLDFLTKLEKKRKEFVLPIFNWEYRSRIVVKEALNETFGRGTRLQLVGNFITESIHES